MKVLWVVNSIFPDFAMALGKPIPFRGGWMYGLANDVAKSGIQLYVATTDQYVDSQTKTINRITYFLLKGKKYKTEYDRTLEPQWQIIAEKVRPDIIHIHGTENAHGLALLKSCPELKYIVSLQGLIGAYARYYTGGISLKNILVNLSFRDLVKNDHILAAQNKFIKRGAQIETPYLKKIKHIIGRTSWDYAHAKIVNRDCMYHFCNESLRDNFYNAKKWQLHSKKEYTIFLSQAGYPLKGLHKVLKAVNFLKVDFPSIKIRVAGGNIIKSSSLLDKLRIHGYGKYIGSLIKEYRLEKHIEFTGPLDEKEMINEYLSCHVFICPSSIENSPNSLGEAQLLGTPSIASYVGGTPDMVQHEITGLLYRFEEVEMLAQCIKKIFNDNEFAKMLSKNGIEEATKRHDRNTNLQNLLEIYNSICTN